MERKLTPFEKAMDYSQLWQIFSIIETMNPEQLASMSGHFIAKRLADKMYKHWMDREDSWMDRIEIGKQLECRCEEHGHHGESDGNVESGSFGFDCVICGWSMSGYM